ncbi:hypothetical protein LKV13_03385 [Borrelia sp. BU AG58]|uniref:hypothetical protein n=1 Tax=Borrelia sp. BU AG58 TaxID=2887345 RepID=UPI001E2DFC8B|nr:hypothetical protein [Borrelia sp. BU AG58]UER67812.1 hypothetical protein LKV13_03385 [Borrelia sp. BU AG58]
MLKTSVPGISVLKYTIIFVILILMSCKDKSITYDRRIKKILDSNKIEYRIDKEGDFIVLKPLGETTVEIIVRSKLNSYQNSKIREVFGVVETFDVNSNRISEISESLMSDSHNNRVFGSWEIINDPERGNNSLVYIVKTEENAKEVFLFDVFEEVASTISIFKKVIKSNGAETSNINNDPGELDDDLQEETKKDSMKNKIVEEELQKIKAR